MNTIAAILESSADGTLHLPIPAAWKGMSIRVRAELESCCQSKEPIQHQNLKGFGCLKGKIAMEPDFNEPLEDFADYTS
jgi:hypothetical protein